MLTKHDLKRHNRLHEGSRPFECKACHRSFSRQVQLLIQDALTRHMRVPDGSIAKCCGKRLFDDNDANGVPINTAIARKQLAVAAKKCIRG